jgi:hypothetical protein
MLFICSLRRPADVLASQEWPCPTADSQSSQEAVHCFTMLAKNALPPGMIASAMS